MEPAVPGQKAATLVRRLSGESFWGFTGLS